MSFEKTGDKITSESKLSTERYTTANAMVDALKEMGVFYLFTNFAAIISARSNPVFIFAGETPYTLEGELPGSRREPHVE